MSDFDITTKIKKYRASHREYSLYRDDFVLNQMVKDGVITQEQLNAYNKSGKNLFGFGFSSDKMLGISLTREQVPQNNYAMKPVYYHPVHKEIIVDENNKIDMSQFSYEAMKARFSEMSGGGGELSVKPILASVDSKKITGCVVNNPDGTRVSYLPLEDGSVFIYISKGKNRKFIKSLVVKDSVIREVRVPNKEIGETTTLYDENGIIYQKDSGNKTTLYSAGKPYAEITPEGRRNILAEDLNEDVSATNALGLPTTRPQIKQDVLNRMNEDNLWMTLLDYYYITGNELINDIENEWGLDNSLKTKLISHINNLKNKTHDECEPLYISKLLLDDIYGLSNSDLEKHVNMINKDNVQAVFLQYKKDCAGKAKETIMSIYNGVNDKFFILSKFFDVGMLVIENIPDELTDMIAPVEFLLEAIDNEVTISKSKRNAMINHIVNAVKNSPKMKKYVADIERDISANHSDIKRLGVDLARLSDRNEIQEEFKFVKPNGKFDVKSSQGTEGDCWLLAALASLTNNPQGKQFIENCLKVNPKNGDVTVNLKGVGKSYVIKAEDIAGANHLASGDGDVRAIELAVDKYLKEQAYNDTLEHININSNWAYTFYRIFLGNGEEKSFEDYKSGDFNNKHKVFSLGFVEEDFQRFCYSVSDKKRIEMLENLVPNHEFIVTGEDEENIYLSNPWGEKTEDKEEGVIYQDQDITNLKPFAVKKEILLGLKAQVSEGRLNI